MALLSVINQSVQGNVVFSPRGFTLYMVKCKSWKNGKIEIISHRNGSEPDPYKKKSLHTKAIIFCFRLN